MRKLVIYSFDIVRNTNPDYNTNTMMGENEKNNLLQNIAVIEQSSLSLFFSRSYTLPPHSLFYHNYWRNDYIPHLNPFHYGV